MYVEKLLLNESLQYSPHSNFRELNKFLDAGIQGLILQKFCEINAFKYFFYTEIYLSISNFS